MLINGATIPELVTLTLREPRLAARHLIGVHPDSTTAWLGLALVVVLTIMVIQIMVLLTGSEGMAGMPAPFSQPLTVGFIQGCIFVLMVFAIHWIGRSFGGDGTLEGAIVVVTWTQFMIICLQVCRR